MRECQRYIITAGLAALILATTARADLRVVVDATDVFARDGTQFIEVYFQETEPATHENLAAFNIRVDLVGATPDGVRFVPPAITPTVHGYVFGAADTQFGLAQGSHAFIAVADDVASGSEANITDGAGVVRIPLIFPANSPEGTWAVNINLQQTAFTDSNADDIPFSVQNATLFIPEPASLGLLGISALGLCRRRQRMRQNGDTVCGHCR